MRSTPPIYRRPNARPIIVDDQPTQRAPIISHSTPKTETLIVGCGYLGRRVAEAICRQSPDERVFATTRSVEKADALASQSITPILADWTDRRSLSKIPPCARVLVSVSYDPQSSRSREESQVGGLRNLLDFLPSSSDIVYISTTGVYHQTQGEWVDESSPARPRAAGGLAHLRGESLLYRHRAASKGTILRLAGIYGPGRIPRAGDVLAGRPIDGPHAGFLNLIHVDDAADAVLAAWKSTSHERLYVVSDDLPVVRRDFYEAIARLSHSTPPVFTSETSESSRSPAAVLSSRSGSNKRIWNRRFRRDLMPRLTYRDYIAGLSALDWTARPDR